MSNWVAVIETSLAPSVHCLEDLAVLGKDPELLREPWRTDRLARETAVDGLSKELFRFCALGQAGFVAQSFVRSCAKNRVLRR